MSELNTDQNQSSASSHIIYSRHHPHLRKLRLLHERQERDRTGLFLIDGVRPVVQALQLEVKLDTVIVAPKMLTGAAAERVVRQLSRAGVPMLSVTPEIYHSFSQAAEPQGIGAVVRQRWEPLHQLKPSRGLCWIAVEAVQSPGNLGTIIRTSEAVGGAGLILIGDNADPYDPATVRASMGALFNQRFVRTTLQEFAKWKRRRQCTLVGTSPAAATDYHAVAYPRPTLLLMGGEKQGLSDSMQALCDIRVKIPMVGRSDSLNVAVATSIMLYELFNQRRQT
jgi:TrmH family RNA methyltransferase